MDSATVRQLDMLMLELGKAPGFDQLMTAVAELQEQECLKLWGAPARGDTLEQIYHRIGRIQAYGEVRGLPASLAEQAVKAREQDAIAQKRQRVDPIVHTPKRTRTARSKTA